MFVFRNYFEILIISETKLALYYNLEIDFIDSILILQVLLFMYRCDT